MSNHPNRWQCRARWGALVTLVAIVGVSWLLFIRREDGQEDPYPPNPVQPATAPNELRTVIVNQVAAESPEVLLDKLLDGYEDLAYAVTGAGLGWESMPGYYSYACAVTTNLTRVRRILSEFRDRIPKPTPKLRAMLAQATERYEKAYKIYNEKSVERMQQEVRPLEFPERDEKNRYSINAHVATYLLAEFEDYAALPVLAKAFEYQGRAPVSRVYTFYSMHRLVVAHPTTALTPDARKARDAYLTATRDVIPPPVEVELPAWDAKVDETDFRSTILGQDIGLKRVAKIRIHQYPRAFGKYEDWKHGAPHEWGLPDGYTLEVRGWYTSMRRFITMAYPP